ncbi:Dabb family protein [Bradyrhizobium sp. ma5]|uniref:Dabb family protein n=1 Tax=Bradyrhizobium sp. ma5 TaxID=3344828 RepID=UPI0035D49B63
MAQIVEGLSVLTAIPYARRLEIARNRKSDQFGNEVDVVVYGEFDSEMDLAAYKTHDLYQEARSGASGRFGNCGLPLTTNCQQMSISLESKLRDGSASPQTRDGAASSFGSGLPWRRQRRHSDSVSGLVRKCSI